VGPARFGFNNGFAYIANADNNTVSKCNVNSSTGEFYDCAYSGSGFDFPQGYIAF
jgi:hypothetical protein